MRDLRPNQERAKHAIALIWAVLAVELISLISGYMQYNLLQNAAQGLEVSTESVTANDLREQTIAIIYLIVYLTSAITFIRWFRRAYFNLHTHVSYLSHQEGWAAGGWFVPIVRLYRPFQIMKELYEETKGVLVKNGVHPPEQFTTSALGWWWALWLITNVLGQFVFRYTLRTETLDDLIFSTVASMITNLLGVPLALITVKVIKDYAEVEPLLHEISEKQDVSNA